MTEGTGGLGTNGLGGATGRAVGYVCLRSTSTRDLAAQRAAIEACCRQRGLTLTRIVHDVDIDGVDQRPSLVWALEQVAERRAEALVVARLHDLSANVANLRPLLTWFDEERRFLIAIDAQLDTSTESGRVAAAAIARAAGRTNDHAPGRPSVSDNPELRERIGAMRRQGMTLQAIADTLNADGVPTLRGGVLWRPSSVQRATGYRRPSSGRRGIEI